MISMNSLVPDSLLFLSPVRVVNACDSPARHVISLTSEHACHAGDTSHKECGRRGHSHQD